MGLRVNEGVDPRAVLDYVSGFSKINNRERFERDVWEGEAQFDRVYRPSASVKEKRIAYLYPDQARRQRSRATSGSSGTLVDLAQRAGAGVVVVKMPLPASFRAKLPVEAAFDAALAARLAGRGVALRDCSGEFDEPRYYFDSDHLNRAGLEAFFARDLKPILLLGAQAPYCKEP